ncbi:MAG: hypothetical protein HN580_30240 [Deltaproteobacteria bacterium]|nr:hypothetical protein [Deltaproteobacteria bacterium]MBT4087097.1 hypothetical protein [Deltaproteobacteria bacterium]MBT4264540.1 hypothetical protein [Deltaproteobacteria bacterium]MBT4638479.1 hypothetical protein [Deltaproteobacteria bacterium]MBT6500730.1 hypothetical protein [Deltaproteobacteria bacterium]
MKLHVTKDSLKVFRQDLWKDLRHLDVVNQSGGKVIRRFADNSTTIPEENDFIQRLNSRVSFGIPEIRQCTDQFIAFRYIAGTRAFNLMIDLKTLYNQEKKRCYKDLGLQLLDLLQSDLKEFQLAMMDDQTFTENNPIYPAGEKLRSLYQVLTEILPETCVYTEIADDLDRIASVYAEAAMMPFRDATPKNMLLEIPSLFQQKFATYAERIKTLQGMCLSGAMSRLLDKKRIYQIDFSGCKFLCPPSDDWMALKEHESTAWLTEGNRSQFPGEGLQELCTRFVRFSRFGGRKLAYRLLNYEGYKIRFVHDNESYYFSTLVNICQNLKNHHIVRSDHLENLMSDLFKMSRFKPANDYLQGLSEDIDQNTYYSDVFPN